MSASWLDIARMAAPNGPGYPDSYYVATAKGLVDYPELEEQLTADVCVIGGGFTGLSAALNLAEMGMDVVLLEAERIGFGATTGRNSSGNSPRPPRTRSACVSRSTLSTATCKRASLSAFTSVPIAAGLGRWPMR